MEVQGSQLQLQLLLLCLSYQLLPLSAWPAQHIWHQEDKLVNKLGNALDLILTNTCCAHNMSVFVSNYYQQQLPLQQQDLVADVLDQVRGQHSKNLLLPVVRDAQLNPELSLQIQLVMFFVQNAEQLQQAAARNAAPTATHKHKFLIVLLSSEGSNMKEMSQIFDYFLLERYNIDVFVLHANEKLKKLDFYSYWPYRAESCASTQPVAVPLLQAKRRQLYPKKLRNLQNCTLSVIVWQILPFISLQLQRATIEQQLDGLDADLLKLLAQKLNFSLNLIPNEPADLIGGDSTKNGTLTGAFQMLRERRGNLTLGCAACIPARSKYLSSTLPYAQVVYVLVVRRGSGYSAFEIMWLPFDGYTWLLLFVGHFLLRLLFRLKHYFCMRPVLVGCTLWLHLLHIGYESSIFKFVHNPPAKPLPQSLEQALSQNYYFLTDHASYRMTELLPQFRQRTRIVPGQPVDIFQLLLEQPLDSPLAVFSSHAFLAHHLTQHPEQRDQFIIMRKKIVDNMICIHFPLGSYLADMINHMLFQLRSFGISQHLGKRLRWDYLPTTKMHPSKPTSSLDIHRFNESMQFVFAACTCLLIAESLIICIFALELISLRRRTQLRWLFWLFQHL